mmetsp:Transcript_34168/g.59710  ORF Transcript_34168/g.59710 Transcript_34168/m.59710 type:complete len:113 (+) Transcript_34168:6926-7264(+)
MMPDQAWPYFLISVCILLDIFFNEAYQKPLFTFVFMFSIAPLVDLVLPLDTYNPSASKQKALKKQRVWQLPITTIYLTDWAFFLWSCHRVSSGSLGVGQYLCLILSTGHIGS